MLDLWALYCMLGGQSGRDISVAGNSFWEDGFREVFIRIMRETKQIYPIFEAMMCQYYHRLVIRSSNRRKSEKILQTI